MTRSIRCWRAGGFACTVALLFGAFASGCVDGRASSAPLASSSGFRAIVYEVQLPPDRAGLLDAGKLGVRAARGEDLRKVLMELGTTRIVYQADHPMDFNCDCYIRFRIRMPYITNSRLTDSGARMNTIQYDDMGATFKVYTQPAPDGADDKLKVRLNANLSIPYHSDVKVAPGVRALVSRDVNVAYSGIIKVAEPFVTVSMDTAPVDPKAARSAYVCRIVIDPADRPLPRGSGATTRPAGSALSTGDFQAIVYRLKMPPDRVKNIDVAALAGATDAQVLHSQLQKLGQAAIVYQASQPVSLTSENVIETSKRKPITHFSRRTANRESIKRVQYEKVGASLRLTVEAVTDPSARSVRIGMNVKLSDIVDGKLEITEGLPAVILHSAEFTYAGNLDVGRPLVGICLDASADVKDEQAVAYIYRIVLSNLR
jgi:hypothetical protein